MGFRKGTFAKVWEVEPLGDTRTKLRISTSFKNKQTDQYEQDFSGYVVAYGTAVARQAAALQKGSRIKLGDVDVTTRYDKEKKIEFTNFKMFSFELPDDNTSSSHTNAPESPAYEGESDESDLPF